MELQQLITAWVGHKLHEQSVLLQELLPILMACAVWGPGWQGLTVVVHCDNLGVMAVVNSGYSKVPQDYAPVAVPVFHLGVLSPVSVGSTRAGHPEWLGRCYLLQSAPPFLFPGSRGSRQARAPPPNLLALLVVQASTPPLTWLRGTFAWTVWPLPSIWKLPSKPPRQTPSVEECWCSLG